MKRNLVCRTAFFISVFFILYMTLLTREPSENHKNMLMHPFWEYANLFHNFSLHSAHDIILNMILFIPFGFSVPLCFSNIKRLKFTAFGAAILSCCIELIQLIFSLGWCEIDDVFNNTIGACIGFSFYKIFDKFWKG